MQYSTIYYEYSTLPPTHNFPDDLASSTPGAMSDDEEICVRESRITTYRDAKFRKVAGTSLCAATLAASAFVQQPHIGAVALSLNAACFGFLQGMFHQ